LVKGYQPDEKISDAVYCEQMAASVPVSGSNLLF